MIMTLSILLVIYAIVLPAAWLLLRSTMRKALDEIDHAAAAAVRERLAEIETKNT